MDSFSYLNKIVEYQNKKIEEAHYECSKLTYNNKAWASSYGLKEVRVEWMKQSMIKFDKMLALR